MNRPCIIRLTVDGETYPIHRDVTRAHPRAVHAALGKRSEVVFQQYLDDCYVADYHNDKGRHLGPDESGLELSWAT